MILIFDLIKFPSKIRTFLWESKQKLSEKISFGGFKLEKFENLQLLIFIFLFFSGSEDFQVRTFHSPSFCFDFYTIYHGILQFWFLLVISYFETLKIFSMMSGWWWPIINLGSLFNRLLFKKPSTMIKVYKYFFSNEK